MGEFSASFRRDFSASFFKSTKSVYKIIKKWYTYDKSEKGGIIWRQIKKSASKFTDEQHKMLVDLAKSKGFSKSAIIVLALEEYLKMQK